MSASIPESLETTVGRFESLWLAGQRPRVDDFLTASAPRSPLLLRELVHAELELRLRAGEPARVEEYLARYPELADPIVLRELIAAEYRQRRRRQPDLTTDEYRQRFPQLPDALLESATSDPDTVSDASRSRQPSGHGCPNVPGHEVLGELGRGGMGVVYKARHLKLNRVVALKMVRDLRDASPEALARFRQEAQAVARLGHPGIVQIYEYGECDEGALPYVALEFCDGGSLAQPGRAVCSAAAP